MDLGDDDLKAFRLLGEGSFGRVYLCKSGSGNSQRFVCVKRIELNNPKSELKMLMDEVYIISQISHPRIVQFIRSYVHAGTVNIVMEYLCNGTLRNLISSYTHAIPKECLLQYFCDMLMGIEYLHIRHVIHRDLKPENLLLDARGRIKIADFGLSAIRSQNQDYSNSLGTPYYSAPEVLRGEKCDFKSDIWSLGCILHELCMSKNPFVQATTLRELQFLVRAISGKRLNSQRIAIVYGSVLADLCEQMLTYDQDQRISLPKILAFDPIITLAYYEQYFDYEY